MFGSCLVHVGLVARAMAVTAWLVIGLVSAVFAATPGTPFKGGVLEPPRPAPDFSLSTASHGEFRLGRQRGRVVVLTFGYTFCPDVCPTTLAELAAVKARLGDAARRLVVVFATVDPERDGPERLRSYTAAFDRTFVAVTGTAEELGALRQAYGVTARKRVVAGTAAAYLVDHSAFIYVVDPEGQLRLMFPFGTSLDTMTHDIQLLMKGR
jgi:protein SCO1/2